MAVKDLLPRLSKRQWIAVGKGTLAYLLTFVLVFLHDFNKLEKYPIVLTSTVLVSIAGKPGVSIGSCLDGGVLGMLGVGVGSLGFLILAKLGHSRVAQGFVFFIFLYLFALVKAQSLRYFAFSLLGIIVSFSGIYTSILLGGQFSPPYLEDYLKAYCWGFAIVLFINLAIFPISSERELRQSLVGSLEHISTFSHLIAKTYTLEITEEEKAVRDQLNQSIRADFAFLSQKISETGYEINWTRWGMSDYAAMTNKIRAMQQGLITSYSSLIAMEKYHPASLEIVKRELVETSAGRAFAKLRRGVDLAIEDMVEELAVGKQVYHSPAEPGATGSWEDFKDMEEEMGDEEQGRGRSHSITPANQATPERLAALSGRLRAEVLNVDRTPTGSRAPSLARGEPHPSVSRDRDSSTAVGSTTGAQTPKEPKVILDRVASLRAAWAKFEVEQNGAIGRLLAEGIHGDDELLLHKPGASMAELYEKGIPVAGAKAWTGHLPNHHHHSEPLQRKKSSASKAEGEGSVASEKEKDKEDVAAAASEVTAEELCSTAVMRLFSFLFGMGSVLDELTQLHEFLVPKDVTSRRSRRLHFHFLERIPKSASKVKVDMSLEEALTKLTGKDMSKPKETWLTRIVKLERLARSETSIYAFKTATAVSVFTVFILAPSLQSFFVNYGLTGGLITIVVAMSPTMGQTFLTFILQVMGTGFGSIFGMVLLYIFKGVGGYRYNPYGLCALLVPYAIGMCIIIYTKPMLFAGALLAMNGTGSLLITEWVYNEVPGQIRPGFDNPALRMAKALVAMSLALGIAGIFMTLILRTPARQTLRIKLAQLTAALASYNILFGLVTEAVVPMQGSRAEPPDEQALLAVKKELLARESQIQMDLLALMPLLKFGAVEPAFGVPFKAGTIARIIRTHQIILDRLREARTACGTSGFSEEIRENFTSELAPYRRQTRRFSRALFYLCATSLATKTPLPIELPSLVTTARFIQHDAMVLSHRLTRSESGREILATHSFTRYWFYLVSYSSVSYQLEFMSDDLRELFGSAEITPFKTE